MKDGAEIGYKDDGEGDDEDDWFMGIGDCRVTLSTVNVIK